MVSSIHSTTPSVTFFLSQFAPAARRGFVVELNCFSQHPRRVSHLNQARKVFDIELAALKQVRAQLDASFDRAVETIAETIKRRGKIVVAGIGKSGNIGRKIAATLTSTGSVSVALNSVDALHGDLGIVADGDVILALSYSGESEELLNLLPALKRFSVKIISLTGNPKSSLARHSDVVLNVKVPQEACPFNLAPTSSTTAMLVMGDALAMAVLQARGFSGRILRGCIPAARLAARCCSRWATSCAPASAMPWRRTTHGEGRAVGDDARQVRQPGRGERAGRLMGVFTDGDFRRHMALDENFLPQPLKKVMTRNPICISRGSPGRRGAENFQRAEH